jgi:deoxyribose-phosphate aldolase
MKFTCEQIASMIDHALLSPALGRDALEAGIDLALETRVASVCIMPWYLERCAQRLAGSGVAPSTVIGFPHGGQATQTKLDEASRALDDGGVELDMVVNVSRVLSGDWAAVTDEVAAITDLTHAAGAKIKVIFENCYFSVQQKIRLCDMCGRVGADWAKTSTGFGPGGSTLEDLRLMRAHCPPAVQIKAAGGIRDLDAVLAAREAGATRVGASRTAEIVAQCRRRLA